MKKRKKEKKNMELQQKKGKNWLQSHHHYNSTPLKNKYTEKKIAEALETRI